MPFFCVFYNNDLFLSIKDDSSWLLNIYNVPYTKVQQQYTLDAGYADNKHPNE